MCQELSPATGWVIQLHNPKSLLSKSTFLLILLAWVPEINAYVRVVYLRCDPNCSRRPRKRKEKEGKPKQAYIIKLTTAEGSGYLWGAL